VVRGQLHFVGLTILMLLPRFSIRFYPVNPVKQRFLFLFKVFFTPADRMKQATKFESIPGHERRHSKEAKASGI
jgi:hypothetical protein